ncbi:metallophosphoesterase [Gracilibacillus alcaliphilus]|uniref:metallophosphoesterase n=1 Tax=Gracilibacillus alcaliphilus TaxID=1401441 RepID=UPI00195A80D0|nr:metallophosphoesterase [Gracilibacillus alcaliphilus]MBM7679369.1 putative MPP superfamily phosphohydrolase [Gracilibacillus alcaliphilus]
MKRRTFLKRFFGGIIAALGLGGGTYYYAREIEPALLDKHHFDIVSSKIPASFEGYTILQFSDTHIGFHYTVEQLTELVNKINQLEPDIIVFTGDLLDNPRTYQADNRLVNALKNIQAKDGKFWIYGNHDHGGYGTETLKDIFDQSDFELLQNGHRQIEKNGDMINLAGIDDALLGQPDLTAALSGLNEDNLTILLAHEPDYAEVAKNYPVDVQLSGHSHGGQVQLPFIGYIYTPPLAEFYVEGYYPVGEKPLQLFVSRGIGTTRAPYRFLCKPEITLYHLKKSTIN